MDYVYALDARREKFTPRKRSDESSHVSCLGRSRNFRNPRARVPTSIFQLSIGLIAALIACPLFAASASSGFGENLEQLAKLAIKDGTVRIAASLEGSEIKTVLEEFQKKYPEIKIEYTTIRGVDSGERILTEALSGQVDYDAVKIVHELQTKFLKAGLLAGPFQWQRLFPSTPKEHISPNGYMAGGSFYLRVIAYNPSLVPSERVPRKWDDCLDPYWKGKLIVDVRPSTLLGLYPVWGEQRVLEYAKKLKENQPLWQRGLAKSLTLLAAGEVPMICGTSYGETLAILQKDPKANVRIAWTTEVPVGLNEALGVLKSAKSPNAAMLLSGWLASPEGQKGYDRVDRGSPFLKGTQTWKDLQKGGAKPVFGGWDEGEYAPALTKKITATWGLSK